VSEPLDIEKIRPYEHLSDPELNQLVDAAVDYRLRMALLEPAQVKASLIAHGCPAVAAERMVANPQMRPHAARFHLDTADALLGDPEAAARVAHMEEGWAKLRRRGAPASIEEARAAEQH
jgi:hypothetical protein